MKIFKIIAVLFFGALLMTHFFSSPSFSRSKCPEIDNYVEKYDLIFTGVPIETVPEEFEIPEELLKKKEMDKETFLWMYGIPAKTRFRVKKVYKGPQQKEFIVGHLLGSWENVKYKLNSKYVIFLKEDDETLEAHSCDPKLLYEENVPIMESFLQHLK